MPDNCTSGLQVLLVDDDTEIHETIAAACEMYGMTITSFSNGVDAVKNFQEIQPDIALVDYTMPKMNGAEVGRKLRSLPGGESTKLYLLSGDRSDAITQLALEAGFDSIIHKPISMKKLMEIMLSNC